MRSTGNPDAMRDLVSALEDSRRRLESVRAALPLDAPAANGCGALVEAGTILAHTVSWLDAAAIDVGRRTAALQAVTPPTVGTVAAAAPPDLPTGRPAEDRRLRAFGRFRALVASSLRSSPKAVAAFFADLHRNDARAIARRHATTVGSLRGVPLPLRFWANRIAIVRELDDAHAAVGRLLQSSAPGVDTELDRLLQRISILRDLLEPGRRILWFSPEAFLLAAEWHGPADASHVLVYLPGTGASIGSLEVHRSRSLAAVAHDPSAGDLAAITSLVYEPPQNLVEARGIDFAQRGAPHVTSFLTGVVPTGRHLTVVAHSYGSTTLGHALASGLGPRLPDDTDLVLLGSPGLPLDSVRSAAHPARHMWSALAPGDVIGRLPDPRTLVATAGCHALRSFGAWFVPSVASIVSCDHGGRRVHGTDPTDPSFGAQVFATDVPLPDLDPGAAHASYWHVVDLGDRTIPGVALGNLLAIALGDYQAVTPAGS